MTENSALSCRNNHAMTNMIKQSWYKPWLLPVCRIFPWLSSLCRRFPSREFPETRTCASSCVCGGVSSRLASSRAPVSELYPPAGFDRAKAPPHTGSGLTKVGQRSCRPSRRVSSLRRRCPYTRSFLPRQAPPCKVAPEGARN